MAKKDTSALKPDAKAPRRSNRSKTGKGSHPGKKQTTLGYGRGELRLKDPIPKPTGPTKPTPMTETAGGSPSLKTPAKDKAPKPAPTEKAAVISPPAVITPAPPLVADVTMATNDKSNAPAAQNRQNVEGLIKTLEEGKDIN